MTSSDPTQPSPETPHEPDQPRVDPSGAASAEIPPTPEPPPPAEPFEAAVLRAAIRRPARVFDIVLAERDRLMATVRDGNAITELTVVLLACSIVAALPFGFVIGFTRCVDVALLFVGSTVICYPSLLVFGSYLGVSMTPTQNLALALVIPAAAALFTTGFFPIYWFLDRTMPSDGGVTGSIVRVVLLVVALALAMSHGNRCLFGERAMAALYRGRALWIGWQALLVFITFRMALALDVFE